MKKNSKYIFALFVIAIICLGYQWNQSRKLDAYYFERFKSIKSGMIFGSSVDSLEELNRYHDQTEQCMHLDGYNGLEIMNLRTEAFRAAWNEKPMNSKDL